jgi:prepilin peptidase CpaA
MQDLSHGATVAAGTLVIAALAWAAWSDLATRTIPDRASLALLAAGLAQRLTLGLEAAALSCLVALALLALLVAAHARGLLGGGDVKLMAAAAAGFPPPGILRFLTAMAIAGGCLALLHLALRRRAAPPRRAPSPRGPLARVAAAESWRIRRRGPLPYGVAIACGAAWVILKGG